MEDIKARHERTLNCPICYNVFTDPVQMTCGHTYCRICLKEFINSRKRDMRGFQQIDCALCRKPSRVHEISMNVNYVVKEATDIYKHLLAMKYIKCSECASNMDLSTRFFYCDTCRLVNTVNQDEIANIICGACGLTSHKEHNVRELEKATENDKRKRRAKMNREAGRSRMKLSELEESMDKFILKIQQIRNSIHGEISRQEAIDSRFDESVMFQKTLVEIAAESKNQSINNCRWIQTFTKQLHDMERRLPQAPPVVCDADVVTLSDDEAQEDEQDDVDDEESSNDSFVEVKNINPLPSQAKIERDIDSEQRYWMLFDNSPSTSTAVNESWGVLGSISSLPSSFQPYPPAPAPASNFPYSYDQQFMPNMYTFPKPVPSYPGRQFLPHSSGYPQLPPHP